MPKTNVTVKLIGTDGNAFSVIGAVSGALRKSKDHKSQVAAFQQEAMAADDYDHMLRICMEWVNIK